jgi:predicted nucleic acid-binding protein
MSFERYGMGDIRTVYFDSNVFLAFIADEPDRAGIVEELLRQAEAGDLRVITSTLSIAEVAGVSVQHIGSTLTTELELQLDSLWVTGGPVIVVEATRRIMFTARDLMRRNIADGFPGLKPPDAIHLATATLHEVDGFYTYDAKPSARWATLTGLTVCEPSVAQGTLDFGSP